MATVQELAGGRKKIRFYCHNGKRRGIHFGKIPKRLADSHAMHVEALVNAKRGKFQADGEHFEWAGKQDERVQDTLFEIGLIPKPERDEPEPEPVHEVPALENWFNQYIENRSASESTKTVWKRAKSQAVKFFGADRSIDSIKVGDAIEWAEAMRKGRGKLADATAKKMLSIARQVFKRAEKFEHIAVNPFKDEDLKTTVGHREKEYIDVQAVRDLLAVLPSAEWRAVVLFARFAGMRVQSELPLLRWVDVQWDRNRFVVRSPKTKNVRRVPIFPEIREALEDLLPITGDSEFVLNALRAKSNNWRTPLEKMMRRAGLKPWKALFNSLRASGESDIARAYGLQCAVEWVGNSVQVAMKHYVRATDSDFERASISGPISGPIAARTDEKQGESWSHFWSHAEAENPQKPNKKRAFCEKQEARSVVPTGLETKTASGPTATTCDDFGCSPNADGPISGPISTGSELAVVVEAWPRLSAEARRKILLIVQRDTQSK